MKVLKRTLNFKIVILSLLSILAYYFLAYEIARSNFLALIACFAFTFAAYFFLIRFAKESSIWVFIILGIFFRLLFIHSIPALSDDYFRFIWDGQLVANGINPFDFIPTEVTIDFPNKATLLANMNSPNYYSVYPPATQILYFLGVYSSPESIKGSVIAMRLMILLAELGTLLLLPKLLTLMGQNPKKSLWYALNPLVIVELSGNLHFEAFVIFLLTLVFYLMLLKKEILVGFLWGIAAAVKLIPLLLLPILLRKWSFKQTILSYFVTIFVFISLWFPFYNATFFEHFFSSLNLYFQTFEFNASFYYFIRWCGYFFVDYNPIQTIGPWFSKIALVFMLVVLLRKRNRNTDSFFNSLLFALSIYFLLALIVHPWYLCTLVFLAVFTNFRYPILWSSLAVLSYFAYSQANFEESYVFVFIEYLLVIVVGLYELRKFSQVQPELVNKN